MMVDVEMAISHFHFMVRCYGIQHELSESQKGYFESMRGSIVSELTLMVELNECNTYHSVLSMYMKSRVLRDFVEETFSTEIMLPRKVVSIAWTCGNTGVIRTCLGLGIDVEAQRNITGAIRSDNTDMVDTCVDQGGSLKLPLLPYRHCRSVAMVNHLSKRHQCRLHDLSKKLIGNHLVSVEYVLLGGHIEEMGELNEELRTQGNKQRSLPIKKAYVRSVREGMEREEFDGLGRFLLLPGCVVRSIASYI